MPEIFPLLHLSGVSLRAVATVCACSGIGAYARRQGVLDDKAQKVMDKLVASVFLPCLILGKVIPHMSLSVLRLIWPMGVMCIFVVIYGLLGGSILARFVAFWDSNAASKFKGLLMVALAFPNSFSVPMTLALALGDHPALLVDGSDAAELAPKIKMLFLMSYAIWVLARWSIGYPILTGAISFREWRDKVLNPPVVATICAGLVGLLWHALPDSIQSNDVFAALLDPFQVAISYGGRCTVPMILFALGARLVDAVKEVTQSLRCAGYSKHGSSDKSSSGSNVADAQQIGASQELEAGSRKAEERANDLDGEFHVNQEVRLPMVAFFAVLIFRQVVGAFFGACVAFLFLRDLCGVSDHAVLLVSMLQSAGPPMINLSVMAGLSGSAEVETAKLLLFTYSASLVTWTVSIAFYLWLLG